MHRNGSWSKKYRKKATNPEVDRPWLIGTWLGMFAKLGQIAVRSTSMH